MKEKVGEREVSKKELISATKKVAKSGIDAEPIKESAKISWDGQQYLIRIPRKIADFFGLKDEKKVSAKFVFNIHSPLKSKDVRKEFDIVKENG